VTTTTTTDRFLTRLIDELLALGGSAAGQQQQQPFVAGAAGQSNITVVDYRQPSAGAPPALAELLPAPLLAGNVQILDIRRTKTNRKRPKPADRCETPVGAPIQLAAYDDDDVADHDHDYDCDYNRDQDQQHHYDQDHGDGVQPQTASSALDERGQRRQQEQSATR
jgi:hypothetical protein